MKLHRFSVLGLTWLSVVALVRADNESLASMFTNSAARPPARRPGLRRPSILLITCRGLAWSDLSCYGQTNFQTPNLDRLAAEGMRFVNYRAGGDDLAHAQAALMTGNSSAPVGAGGTVAAQLQPAGYRTGLLGEWAFGPEPWKQGFYEFTGFLKGPEADNYFSDFVWNYSQHGVAEGTNYVLHPRFARERIFRNEGGHQGQFMPDFLVGLMLSYMTLNVPDAANHYRPFFLMVNLPLPHSVTPGKDDYPAPTDAPFSEERWPQAAKNRAALVARLDDHIGRLLERLQSLRLTNNLALFVAGATAPEKFADARLDFLRLPGDLREGDSPDRLRVPLIVHWPGHVPAGRVIRAPWSAADFAQTAVDIAGVGRAGDFAGDSMLPVLLGRPATNSPAGADTFK